MKTDELRNENNRLKAALNYILLLADKKDPHLGHPRLTDMKCIFCMAYFALNNGDYGYFISEVEYKGLANKLKKDQS